MRNGFCSFSAPLKIALATALLLPIGSHAAHSANDMGFKSPLKMSETSNDYVPRYSNGLYSTIAGFLNIQDSQIKNVRELQLTVPGFKSRVPVKAVIQPHAAPLVIVIPGLDGKADSKLGKLWPAWYSEAGYHVLTFDSTFTWSFNAVSGHGASGHIGVEAQCVRDLVESFLKSDAIKDKVSRIGVVGMSYGGIQALMLGQMQKDNALPFKIDAIQVWSPPVNMQRTCEILDKWYAEDRWNYTLAELATKMSSHKPVAPGKSIPFSDEEMRAGIAAVFRLDLANLILKTDRAYKLNLLPSGNNEFDAEDVRKDHASTWGFQRFVSELTFPYWEKRLKLGSVEELTSSFELRTLLPKQASHTEVIIAADDPFNTAEDLMALDSVKKECALNVLKGGGHLGFVAENWTKAKLLTLFKTSAAELASSK